MKILELNFSKEWRGGERQTLLNIRGLQQKNHAVALLCRKDGLLHKKALENNMVCFAYKNIFSAFWFLINRAKKFDLIHAQTAHILTYCVLSKPFHHKKIVYTRRVNFSQSGFFTKLKYRLTDKLVAISTPVQKQLSEFTGRNDIAKISDIAIKETQSEILTEKLAKINPSNKKIIGIVAALTYEKQPLVCLQAMQLLHQQNKNFICLHFGSGPLMEEMQQKITASKMAGYYHLMGFHQNVLDWFNHFDIFLMTSLNEGLGSSVLDAYLNNIPVVSGISGGLADIVSADKAMVCESPVAETFCEKTAAILSNPDLAKELSANAHRFVAQYHSIDYITGQYEQLFQRLLK